MQFLCVHKRSNKYIFNKKLLIKQDDIIADGSLIFNLFTICLQKFPDKSIFAN